MTIDGADASGDAAAATTRSGANWTVFVATAATVLILDQLTKAWLVANVSPGGVVNVAGDLIRLIFTQNSGALFGLFRDNAVLFGLASLAVVAFIVLYHAKSGRSRYLSLTLGLLLGGALGNLTDRFRLGYVVDFVDIGIGNFRWYTFNVADAAVSTAIVLLVAAAFVPALSGRLDRRADG